MFAVFYKKQDQKRESKYKVYLIVSVMSALLVWPCWRYYYYRLMKITPFVIKISLKFAVLFSYKTIKVYIRPLHIFLQKPTNNYPKCFANHLCWRHYYTHTHTEYTVLKKSPIQTDTVLKMNISFLISVVVFMSKKKAEEIHCVVGTTPGNILKIDPFLDLCSSL